MKTTGRQGRFMTLWGMSRGVRLLYAGALAFMALSIFMSYLVPQIIRFTVDSVVGDVPVPAVAAGLVKYLGGVAVLRENLLILGGLVMLVTGLGGFCGFVRGRWVALSAERLINRLRDKLFSHIQSLPHAWHVRVQTGDIIQRCTSDVDVVREFVHNQLPEMFNTVTLVTVAYAFLFSMNTVLALTSFLFLPVMVAYSVVFLSKISHRFLVADEAEGQLLSVAQENLTGVRVVRAFGRERHEIDRFDKQNRHFANLWVKLGDLLCLYWGASDLLTYLQILAVCVAAVFETINGGLTVGEFIVFMSYNSMLIWPVRGLGRVLSEASKTGVSLGRIKEILDEAPEQDAPDALTPEMDGDVVFHKVCFSYDGEPVLRDVSFTAQRGLTLGILGGTGSGKTTAAHLLCRLYELEEDCGQITVGGVDIKNIKRAWLRKNIGIVMQEPFLFSRTIRENIASLSPGHDLERIRRAASISCIDESVESFSHGYDTVVGERGVTLSGGQKQRVAIARAIIDDPPILIFDDSLSAVDTETDTKIRAALNEKTGGVTTIIIAHRITSISKADKIIVLDKGRVAETGSHAELLRQNGIYRRVYDLQSSVEEELGGDGA